MYEWYAMTFISYMNSILYEHFDCDEVFKAMKAGGGIDNHVTTTGILVEEAYD
jgi:hypothetical protein